MRRSIRLTDIHSRIKDKILDVASGIDPGRRDKVGAEAPDSGKERVEAENLEEVRWRQVLEHVETCEECSATFDEFIVSPFVEDSFQPWIRPENSAGTRLSESAETVGVCPRCREAFPKGSVNCPRCRVSSAGSSSPTSPDLASGRDFVPTPTQPASSVRPRIREMLNAPGMPLSLTERFEVLVPPDKKQEDATIPSLGQGGMGIVYLARDRRLGREVVIKIVHDHSRDLMELFEREARILASLEHDNIVRLYDFGLADGTPYLVMEYVRGKVLSTRLNEGRPPMIEAVRIVRDVLFGVLEAHRRGIVHRDLKPANIFLDPSGRAKVADFGLARAIGSSTEDKDGSPSGMIMGTPGYMSPEQCRGERMGPPSDVYSVGIILHELLTGQRLFRGASPHHVIRAQVSAHPPSVSKFNPSVPKALDDLVARALSRSPDERPTCESLIESLDTWLAHVTSRGRARALIEVPPRPYKLLDHFQVQDAPIYFGRDAEIVELVELLETPDVRVVFLFGPCGIGKSSLIRAGIVPALDPTRFDSMVLISGRDPDRTLAAALAARACAHHVKLPTGEAVTCSALEANPRRMIDVMQHLDQVTDRNLVVIVDQLDELFTQNPRGSGRIGNFFRTVELLVEAQSVRVQFILSYRIEFHGELSFLAERLSRYRRVMPLVEIGEAGLAQAIEGPSQIESFGFRYEQGLPARLASDVLRTSRDQGQAALPCMQIICTQLFDCLKAQKRDVIDGDLYESAVGGVEGALIRYVEERLSGPDYARRGTMARKILKALTLKDEGGERYSLRRLEDELLDFPDREAARRTLESLISDHLVAREECEDGQRRVRLSSEVICPLIDQWQEEPDDAARAVQILARGYRDWVERGRCDDDLLTGSKLGLVEEQKSTLPLATPAEIDYATRSTEKRDREERARRRRNRALVTVFGMLAAVSVVMWTKAAKAEREERAERVRTEVRFLVARAIQAAPVNFERAISDVVVAAAKSQASGEPPSPELQGASLSLAVAVEISKRKDRGVTKGALLRRDSDQITSLAFSPDGKTIVSGLANNRLRLWDSTGKPFGKPFEGHSLPAWSVAFCPDGKTIASGSVDRTIRLWTPEGKPVGEPFTGHSDAVTSVAFCPDGKTIVSGSADRTIRLWTLGGRPMAAPFVGHTEAVRSVVFSPDGNTIASGSEDGTILLWGLDGKSRGVRMVGHLDRILSVAFSPDGRTIASGSADHTVRLWHLDGRPRGIPGVGHTAVVDTVAFSPNGQMVLSGSADRTIQLWSLDGKPLGVRIQPHISTVTAVAFNPNGKTIATASNDSTVRLWPADYEDSVDLLCSKVGSIDLSDPDESSVRLAQNLIAKRARPSARVRRSTEPTIGKRSPAALTLPVGRQMQKSSPGPLPTASPVPLVRSRGTTPTRDMVLIPAGEFLMGSSIGITDEQPAHRVWVDAFYIDRHSVTNRQYREFVNATGHRRSVLYDNIRFNGDAQPVVGVSFEDANEYCRWAGLRLPTEAEREKAARGGLEGQLYPWGNEEPARRSWYAQNSSTGRTRKVASFPPNGYGLFDMAGNVWEWCSDWFSESYYSASPSRNPSGPATGILRVVRGGAWDSTTSPYLRCSHRFAGPPAIPESYQVGFRCAKSVK